MSMFYIDFASLNTTIAKYENMIKKYTDIKYVLMSTTNSMTEEVWSGDDADIMREEFCTMTTESMPYAINKLNDVKNALEDEKDELRACKQFGINLRNAFGRTTSGISVTGESGIVKCDFDALSLSVDYGNDLLIESLAIKRSFSDIDSLFLKLSGSYDDLYEKVEKIKNDIEGFDVIEEHKNNLVTYGGMVRDADDHLNTRLKEILSDDYAYVGLSADTRLTDSIFSKDKYRTPEYIFCINAIENGSIDPSDLAAYNLCVEKILQSKEADDFSEYIKNRCYNIEADEWCTLLTSTLLVAGEYVRSSGDPDMIDDYKKLGFYLMDDLGIQINPLAGPAERMGLSNPDFVKVVDDNGTEYYGLNQSWFEEDGRFGVFDKEISESACGWMALKNTQFYLEGAATVDKERFIEATRLEYCLDNLTKIEFASPLGYDPIRIGWQLEAQSQLNCLKGGKVLTAEWTGFSRSSSFKNRDYDFYDLSKLACDIPDLDNLIDNYQIPTIEKMQEMLDNDIPVIMSYHSQTGEELIPYLDAGAVIPKYKDTYSNPDGFSSHYYTVTGIIYNVEKNGEYTTVLEISNWGEKQYLDYSEYVDKVSKGVNLQNNSSVDVLFNEAGNGILYLH